MGVSADLVVASFPPPIARNPYQRLLYEHLAAEGVVLDAAPRLRLGWMWRNRSRVQVLHFHWPEWYYRHASSSQLVRALVPWPRFVLFAIRLWAARLLGYRLIWTVHQVTPHEAVQGPLDQLAARVLASLSVGLIVHDEATASAIAREFGAKAKVHLIPHGSYVGVYPEGRARGEVRRALAIPDDSFVVLSFGQVRRYKDLGLLVDAFTRAAIEGAVLVIAGLPTDEEESKRLLRASQENRFLVPLLDYIPDERVAELYGASDVAVSARGDGGTSGALILALSLGLPVVAASAPAYAELTGEGSAGWLFTPGDAGSLATMLRAAMDASDLADRAQRARECAGRLAWPEIAARTAALFRSL